jgi:hypothetical protein
MDWLFIYGKYLKNYCAGNSDMIASGNRPSANVSAMSTNKSNFCDAPKVMDGADDSLKYMAIIILK